MEIPYYSRYVWVLAWPIVPTYMLRLRGVNWYYSIKKKKSTLAMNLNTHVFRFVGRIEFL